MASIPQRIINKLRRIALRKLTQFRSPLKAAVIGYGGIGPDHADAYDFCGLANLVAVSDVNAASLASATRRRPQLRAYMDYKHMLEESRPDVVSICTWPQFHASMVEEVAKAGVKAILCEKPLALTLEDIETMERVCRENGVKFAVAHQYRFNPWFITAREMVRTGAFGAGLRVSGHVMGVLADNGPHLLDAVRFILNDAAPKSARGLCRREKDGMRQGMPCEESFDGSVTFENGVTLQLRTGETAPSFFEIRLEGSKGSAVVTPSSLSVSGQVSARPVKDDKTWHNGMFREFVRWTKGSRRDLPTVAEHGKKSVEMMLALYQSSAQGGSEVPVPAQERGEVLRRHFPGCPEVSAITPLSPPEAVRRLPVHERLAVHGGARAMPKAFDPSPTFGMPELLNLGRVLLSRRLTCTEGDMVNRFQSEYAEMIGASHAVASTSGTSAIHVAMGALGLNPGDEVITTPLSDMGTVIPILACNCLPAFADIDPATGNLTANTIAAKLTPRTKAIIVVHLFGRPADMDPIMELVKGRGIAVIEDCAQAHLAEYRGRKVGTIGDLGCFSFQQSKQITCGDGGLTVTNNEELAERAALFSDKGWLRGRAGRAGRNHKFLGMNYRMTELQGAVALAQTRRLTGFIKARRESAELLGELLQKVPGIELPPDPPETSPSWWLFAFSTSAERGISPADFCGALGSEGVSVTGKYLPMALFEYDVIKHRMTYGTSGYPLSAFEWQQPRMEDFPGFQSFNERMLLIGWSHNALPKHARQAAAAVKKVMEQWPS
jgi:perosamine synthetase